MNRRAAALIVTLVLGLLTAFAGARAQPPDKVRRIGFLGPSPASGGLLQAFEQGLRELGYIEGKNVVIERRYTDAAGTIDEQRLVGLAAELVQLKPEVLVVSITEAALAAKKATTTIPVVMVNVGDPVGNGLVASIARPGGNITGLSRLAPELIGKALEILKETVPKAEQVAVLMNPNDPVHTELVTNVRRAASSLGVQLRVIEAPKPSALEPAFATMARERMGAVLVLPSGMFYLNRTRIAELALRGGLPSMFGSSEMVKVGGLLEYAPSSIDNYRRAATFVDKILKGARPGDLPVQQPTKFELVINMKTAKALGLTIPPAVLLRADHVIQ